VRAFVTGATGFIGGALARRIRDRGDEVVALVRTPRKADHLRELGCELATGSLESEAALRDALDGCDAAFHAAARYQVGVPRSQRAAMFETNVRGTERVLDAAVEAGVGRIVHVSTVNVLGNTGGRVPDETYHRPEDDRFLSAYDETKYLAHRVAEDRMSRGAPVSIAQPGGVYGPGDTSDLGILMRGLVAGAFPYRTVKMFPDTGILWAHVDDVAAGILLVHDRGRIGESYILGGERGTLDLLIDTVCRVVGRRPPRVTVPPWLVRAGIPFGPLIGRWLGIGSNLREYIRAADGVTYWASDARARRELGYAPRDLETGIRDTLAAM